MKKLRFNKSNQVKIEDIRFMQDYRIDLTLKLARKKLEILKGKIKTLETVIFPLRAQILTLSEPALFNEEYGFIPLQGYPGTYRLPNKEGKLEISSMTVGQLKTAIKRVNKKLNLLYKEKEIAFIFIEQIDEERKTRIERHRGLVKKAPTEIPVTGKEGAPVPEPVPAWKSNS